VKSILLLLLAISVGSALGVAGTLLLRLLLPGAPVWVGVPIGVVGLVITMRYIVRRFEWIAPWYYLMPAILFLLAFTFFPVVLTLVLAFTDYAGIRNGQLNVGSETGVVSVDGATLTVADPTTFDCADLRNGCTNVRALVYASATLEVPAESIEDARLTLAAPPPEGRGVTGVELFLPDLGFSFESTVLSVDGSTLILDKAPPFPPDLTAVTLRLDRSAVPRTIEHDEGAVLTLDRPLPEGLEPTAIARYNAFGWIGARNFTEILTKAPRALIPVFLWNVSFAVLTVAVNTAIGVFIAVLLNNPALRFRNLYRTLLIVPSRCGAVSSTRTSGPSTVC
jgi:arabinogalactan oligomer/maltooligosaccharide transport system permease protein